MVQDIECLGTDFEPEPFVNREFPADRQIQVELSGCAHGISAEIADARRQH